MAGNRQVFDQAMNAGHSSAWDQDWNKAITSYARAIQEIPESPDAHVSLGFALLQSARLADALKVYERACRLAPDDPVPLEKSADVLERLGRLQEAAQRYIQVADIYLGKRDLEKAIGNWERATLLTPGLLNIHYRLAQAYERTGRKRPAVLQYLTLAFNFQRAEDKPKALQAIERALRLEPSNPQVLNAKRAIEAGELMPVPKAPDEAGTGNQASAAREADMLLFADQPTTAQANPDGPLGEAVEVAMAALAEMLLDGDFSTIGAASQGISSHKLGETEQAIAAFKKAESLGMRSLPLYMCLAFEYTKLEKWPEAQKYLERVQGEKEYAAGAAHGLGKMYMALNQPGKASNFLIKALQLADTGLAMNPDEASQLTAVYTSLHQTREGMQESDLSAMNEQFAKWLVGPDWKVRIPETRRSLNARLTTSKSVEELKYYVTNTQIVDIVTGIDRLIRQGKLDLAMEEAFRAIVIEPLSLPVHQRIAQVLMEGGKVQQGIEKYNMVAQSFLVRDDRSSAADILNEVIKVAPMDTSLRTSLIELLEREEEWGRVLEEYVGLADAYYQLADMEQARATYQEALKIAQRVNSRPDTRAEILHRVADIDLSRLDLRQAQRSYEQVRTLLPDDERARRALIDINYRLNNPLEAVKELDALLRMFAQTKRGELILSTLEGLVQSRSDDMALRSRLAAVYKQIKRKEDAIAQLDVLGELQLEAGLYQDACATVKQIIALGPENLEQYKQLLSQLGC